MRPANRLSRASLAAFLLLLLAQAGPAGAQGIVVSAGREGGYYHTIANRLRNALSSEQGVRAEVRYSPGSLENLARLDDPSSPVNVALTQADALRRYLDEHPGFDGEFNVLADIGTECAFIVAPVGGPVKTAADLKAEAGLAISVGDVLSGGAVTWDYMGRLEPAFRNTRVAHSEIMAALLEIRGGGEFSDVKSVLVVQRPRLSSVLEVVLDNLDVYRLVPIRAGDLGNATLPSGSPIYTFETVRVGVGRDHSASVETLCTHGLLLATPAKLSEERFGQLADVILKSGRFIMPGAK